MGQLLTLTEGTISTLNGGLHLSCDKLDGIDPIDDILPITNVLEETDPVGKYSTDQLTEVVNDGNPLQAELKKKPDASLCLVKDSTTSLAETHCSDTLTSRSLVVDSGLSIGTEQLQFQNEAGVCKNDISKAIDICYTETPKLETGFRPDIVGNLEVYMSDSDDSDNENKSRWQLNTFPTHGSSEDANFKPQQSSSFNSHKKSLNQNLERLKRDRKSTLGHPELNQTLGDLCKPEVLLPQSKPHFRSEQLQYFNTFNNGFSPTSVPPQGQFLSAGYQGNETTSQQFVRPPFANQHEQLISRKKPCRNKRSTYGYKANRHRQTGKQGIDYMQIKLYSKLCALYRVCCTHLYLPCTKHNTPVWYVVMHVTS